MTRFSLPDMSRPDLFNGGHAIFTDPVVITGPVTNEELAALRSIGLFVFVPKGLNGE